MKRGKDLVERERDSLYAKYVVNVVSMCLGL